MRHCLGSGLMLLGATFVSGCADAARNQCLRAAVAEVRTIDRLIADTEAGLARGYGIDRETVPYLERRRCDGGGGTCLDTGTEIVTTPKTIDPASATRRLALLKERRAAAVQGALDHVAACRERYPG